MLRSLTIYLYQEQPSYIKQMNIPKTISQTCKDWAYFAGHDYVDQIDLGV